MVQANPELGELFWSENLWKIEDGGLVHQFGFLKTTVLKLMLPLFCFVDFGTFAEAHRWDPIQIETLPAVSVQKIHEDGGATLEQVDEFEWKCTPMPTNEQ